MGVEVWWNIPPNFHQTSTRYTTPLGSMSLQGVEEKHISWSAVYHKEKKRCEALGKDRESANAAAREVTYEAAIKYDAEHFPSR